MTNRQILSAADVWVNTLIWLPGVLGCDHPPQVFAEFCTHGLPRDTKAPLFSALPELAEFAEQDSIDIELVAMTLADRDGLLVEGAHPIRTYLGEGRWESSPGAFATEWFYVPSPEDIAPVLALWAGRIDGEALSRFEVSGPAS